MNGNLSSAPLVAILLALAQVGCACGGKPSLEGDGGEPDEGVEDGVGEAADSEDLPVPDMGEEEAPDDDANDIEEEEVQPPVFWSGSYSLSFTSPIYAATSRDGGFFAKGGSSRSGVMRLDGRGQPSWCMSYESFLEYHIHGLRQFGGEPGFHAFGEVRSDYSSDVWLMEVEASGAILWQKIYRHLQGESARSILKTDDGGYIVAGHTGSFGAGGSDALLLRLNGQGEILWQFCYGSEGDESFAEILPAPGGGFISAGSDFWIVAVDESGGIEWQKSYGGPAQDGLMSFDACPGGGYIAAGFTESSGMGGTDFLVVRIDENGGILWQKSYGTGEDEEGGYVAATADGGFILAGHSWPTLRGILLKLNAEGDIVWQRSWGLEENFQFLDGVEELPGGGFFAWGRFQIISTAILRTWLLKTDADGLISPDCPPGFVAETSLVSSDAAVTVTGTEAVRTPAELWSLDADAAASECNDLLAETICDSW